MWHRKKIRRRGFTLIELLVVIAIIALLLSILMPALQKVKEQARRIVCASRLKDLGVTIRLYAESNGDWLPPYDNTTSDRDIRNFVGENHGFRWLSKTGQYLNLGHLWTGKYIEDGRVFFCPSPLSQFKYQDYADPVFPTEILGGTTGVRISYSYNPECNGPTYAERYRKYERLSKSKGSMMLLVDLLSPAGITHEKGWNVLHGDGSVNFSISREALAVMQASGADFINADYEAFDEVIELLR